MSQAWKAPLKAQVRYEPHYPSGRAREELARKGIVFIIGSCRRLLKKKNTSGMFNPVLN